MAMFENKLQLISKSKKLNYSLRRWLYDITGFRSQIGSLSEGLPMMISSQEKRGGKGEKKAAILERIQIASLRSGNSFASAIQPLVPEDEFLLIMAGESSGDLSKGLIKANERLEQKHKTLGAIKKTIQSTLVRFAMIFGVFGLLGNTLFPTLERINPIEQWPSMALNVYSLIQTMHYWLTALILVIALIVFIVLRSLSHWLNNDYRQFFMNHCQPWNLYRDITAMSVLDSLAALSVTLSEEEAIRALKKTSKNPWLIECYDMMLSRLKAGEGNPLMNNPLLEIELADVIVALGSGGDKRGFYQQAAERLKIQINERMEKVNEYIETISLLVMFSMLGAMISSYFMVSLTSITQGVSS